MYKILKEQFSIAVFYALTIGSLYIGILNIFGEDAFESFAPSNKPTSSIIRSFSKSLTRSIGMDAFFENLNKDL